MRAEITPWHVSFGLRLRRARERARYSTRDVAHEIEDRFQLQFSHGSLARIERGEQRISVGMLGVLCDIYEVAPLEVAIGAEPNEDSTWYGLVRAGLEGRVVKGVVWLEQMLARGSASGGPPPLRDGQLDFTSTLSVPDEADGRSKHGTSP